jgi:hypothetical protein
MFTNLLKNVKRILDPESEFQEDDFYNIGQVIDDPRDFSNQNVPCKGSLIIDHHCKGCRFESEHVDGR